MCCLLFLGACGALFNIGIWLLVVAFVCLVVVSLCFIDVCSFARCSFGDLLFVICCVMYVVFCSVLIDVRCVLSGVCCLMCVVICFV